MNPANKALWSELKNRNAELVGCRGEWASSLHASKIHLKIGGEIEESWSLCWSGSERGGTANWTSVPLLNLMWQQQEEEEYKEEEGELY